MKRKRINKAITSAAVMCMAFGTPFVHVKPISNLMTVDVQAQTRWIASGMFSENVTWKLDDDNVLHIYNSDVSKVCQLDFSGNEYLTKYLDTVSEIRVEDVVVASEIICDGMNSLECFDMGMISSVRIINGSKSYVSTYVSFENCKALKEVDLSRLWITDARINQKGEKYMADIRGMFSGCDSLRKIIMPSQNGYCCYEADTGIFSYEGKRFSRYHYPAVFLPTGSEGYGESTQWRITDCPNEIPKGPKGTTEYLSLGDFATMTKFAKGYEVKGKVIYEYPPQEFEYEFDQMYPSITSYEWGYGQTYELVSMETELLYDVEGYEAIDVSEELYEELHGKLFHLNEKGTFDYLYDLPYDRNETYYVKKELTLSESLPATMKSDDSYHIALSDIIHENETYHFAYGNVYPTTYGFTAPETKLHLTKDLLKDLSTQELNNGLKIHLVYSTSKWEKPQTPGTEEATTQESTTEQSTTVEATTESTTTQTPTTEDLSTESTTTQTPTTETSTEAETTEEETVLASDIDINKSSVNILVGQSYRLKATITPGNVTNGKVNWISSNSRIATVSSSGKVNAKRKGTVTITAATKDGSGKKETCKITVKQPVTKIQFAKKKITLKKGNSCKLKVSVLPANANNKTLKWKTENSKIAKVSATGKVTAQKKGTVNITARAKDGSGKKCTCKIVVK